ncbi:virulence protein E [Paraburkholderia tropica]|uniref:VapE domain-containing protein n=1 Tax=Paraburkholderia tropica TaxID=92647 RepID=UPI0016040C4F|nr:VapE domain-containing protein [Paraburkholderia tropica]QNB10813.1 virulence protein E [Paraburkholderia tropica]
MATLDQIANQLMAAGHPKPPEGHPRVSDNGRPHRYGPGKKYWYSIHEIVQGGSVIGYTGAFGYWSGNDNGAQTFRWEGAALSPETLAESRQRQKRLEEVSAAKAREKAKLAANRARSQWDAASEDGASEYLGRKQITPEGVRFAADGTLYVPMYHYRADGAELAGLQKIAPNGSKLFNKGMEKGGAALQLGDIEPDDKLVMIAEGYATGRSIRMATENRIPLVVCFDAGGIHGAARSLREACPDIHILICADDDWVIERRMREHLRDEYGFDGEFFVDADDATQISHNKLQYAVRATGKRDDNGVSFIELVIERNGVAPRVRRFENTGVKYARAAAAAVGNASVTIPMFAGRGERKLTDFNDLHVEEGLHVVKAQVESALLAALAPANDEIPPFPHLHAVDRGQDPLYEQAAAHVRKGKRISISALQRELKIGYNRAAHLLDDLEKAGVVSAVGDNGVRSLVGTPSATPSSADAESDTPEWDGVEGENSHFTWQQRLRRAEKSNALLPCLDNVFAILTHDKRWQGVLAFEKFALRIMKLTAPPFEGGEKGEWGDRDDARCALWLGQNYSFSPRPDVIADAVFLAAERNSYHEVRDYLAGLQWDRQPRLRGWLTTWLGVQDSEYVRHVSYKWLLGAVGRVMRPGCKMDNVLIFEGKQDAGKSAAFRTLFGPGWFTDANIVIGDKDSFAVMAGKWVIELAELDALSKSDSSNAKRFFTTAVDTYRPPYARRAIDVPRQSVFGGTVNFDTYLKDESGNRRYWPVRTADVLDLKGLAANRDQIWAEAYTEYCEWERANAEAEGILPAPWQVLPEEKHLFSAEQDARYEGDIYETMIARFCEFLPRVTMEDILNSCLKLEISKWTPAEQRRIGKAMKSLGWVRKRESKGTREWYYEPPAQEPVSVIAADGALAEVTEDDDAPL